MIPTIQASIQLRAETKANELLNKAFDDLKKALGIVALPIARLQSLKNTLSHDSKELSLEYVIKQLISAARPQIEANCLKTETTEFLSTMEQLKEFTQTYQ